ncbi:MAG TPA: hypothetical protein VLU94_01455 [Candidatus Nitrosotalea sp.]|nr:hypothetical protein [Candidatus Nitrosotalea sp.]
MTERNLLLDCLRRLNNARVDYMLTGSMACNAWGIPRTTHDLDFVVRLTPIQIPTFVAAFASPDYRTDEASVHAASEPPHRFHFVHLPSALKADFWRLRPVPFEREMFSRRLQDNWFGETLWLATAEDVILHKLYWNRTTRSHRQLGDVAGVVKVQRGHLDRSYLRRWAGELGVSKQVEAALSGTTKSKRT